MANKFCKPVLFSYFRSSATWRVRTALAYKGIEYEYKAVNIMKGDQFNEEFTKLNPLGQVPALVIDGITLTQSLPIIEYLEETRPEKNLLPKDPAKRAKARQIAEIVNSGIQPITLITVQKRVADLGGDEKKQEWTNFYTKRGFEALEQVLQESAGKFCVGDDVTIADLCLIPQVFNANVFNVDLTAFPTVRRIYDTCLELDYFKAASPFSQPDCPPELRK